MISRPDIIVRCCRKPANQQILSESWQTPCGGQKKAVWVPENQVGWSSLVEPMMLGVSTSNQVGGWTNAHREKESKGERERRGLPRNMDQNQTSVTSTANQKENKCLKHHFGSQYNSGSVAFVFHQQWWKTSQALHLLIKSWTKWRKTAVSTYLESVGAPPFKPCAQGNRITQKKKPRTTFLLSLQNQPLQLSSDALIKGHPWYSHQKNIQLYYESAGSRDRDGWVVHLFAARGLCWFGIAFMLDPGPCIMRILFRY